MSNKNLNEQINEAVDFIIDNKMQNVNEGIIGNILYFFNLAGFPRDRKIKTQQKLYNKCIDMCNKTYHSDKTVYTSNKDAYSSIEDTDERDLKNTERMDEQLVRENPEKARCITRCRVTFLRSMIRLIKSEGPNLCKKNMLKDQCEKWLEDKLPELESELEYLEQAVMAMKKINDDKKLQRILTKTTKQFTSKS